MAAQVIDPKLFCRKFWPHYYETIYDKQWEIVYSVVDNYQTFVPAGNMLGKDFISAFIVLWFFMSRTPCKVITTSADYDQLKLVLWGEMDNFLDESVIPLRSEQGGPLVVNELFIRKKADEDTKHRTGKALMAKTFIKGRVAKKGEGMLGNHLPKYRSMPHTLLLIDEASGVDDEPFNKSLTWAHRVLVIGNPFPCSNFFYHGVKGGDIRMARGGMAEAKSHTQR